MLRRVLLLLVACLLVALAGCSQGTDTAGDGGSSADGGTAGGIESLTVDGAFGKKPSVDIQTPLDLEKSQHAVLIEGDGPPVRKGKQVLVQFYLASGKTGKKIGATWDRKAPQTLTMDAQETFPRVVKALTGVPQGSRVAVALTPQDAYGKKGAPRLGVSAGEDVVFVFDVLSVQPSDVLDGPKGDHHKPPAAAPDLVTKHGRVTGFSFTDAAKPPDELKVYTLVEGHGPPARKASLVTFDYLGQVYGSQNVFDESYTSKPRSFAVGVGGLIPAWDQAIVGAKKGSRLLLVVPPKAGYGKQGNPRAGIKGTDTLVFVVDILGVS